MSDLELLLPENMEPHEIREGLINAKDHQKIIKEKITNAD